MRTLIEIRLEGLAEAIRKENESRAARKALEDCLDNSGWYMAPVPEPPAMDSVEVAQAFLTTLRMVEGGNEFMLGDEVYNSMSILEACMRHEHVTDQDMADAWNNILVRRIMDS